MEETPEGERHLRITMALHVLRDDERQFVTEDLLRQSCIVGRPDEIVGRIKELEEAGLDEILMLPSPETQVRFAQQLATEILPRL